MSNNEKIILLICALVLVAFSAFFIGNSTPPVGRNDDDPDICSYDRSGAQGC